MQEHYAELVNLFLIILREGSVNQVTVLLLYTFVLFGAWLCCSIKSAQFMYSLESWDSSPNAVFKKKLRFYLVDMPVPLVFWAVFFLFGLSGAVENIGQMQ